jgi:4'-phosphopantetheinyl transferase
VNNFLYKDGLQIQPLTDSDIHVWRFSIEPPQQELESLFLLLSPDEKTRAERFYFERDRNRFIAARGLLRTIIAGYVDMPPSQIEFVYGNFGKPALKSQPQGKALEFNLSHSQDLALYIFNRNRQVGIDVEHVRSMPDMDNFAEQFFSSREIELINSLSGEQKNDAFFKLWTGKEALLKANGGGLTIPLSYMEISLDADGSVTLRSIDGDRKQAARWRLESFMPAAGYRASLAVEGCDGQVVFL